MVSMIHGAVHALMNPIYIVSVSVRTEVRSFFSSSIYRKNSSV